MYCTGIWFYVFTEAFVLLEVRFCMFQPLKMLLCVLDESTTGHICTSAFILLLSSSDTSAVMMPLQLPCCIRRRCFYDPSGQNRFPPNYLNDIWAQGREEDVRPGGRSAVIEP